MTCKTVEVTDEQAAFLKRSPINFSRWVRDHIDEEMNKEVSHVIM